ncbi:MAG: S1C family serine protease [Deltaproteobacteria bacterium]
MNASLHLLRQALPTTVHIYSEIAADHASARILGTERMGTGTILAGSGLIVTAHYLLIGADQVELTLHDERRIQGRVVGVDFDTGLGLVAPDQGNLSGLEMRSIADVGVGEEAFLVASIGDGRRVSSGFVTALEPFDALWEFAVDPALFFSVDSPGLGGGPLVDNLGRMVGVSAFSLAEVGRFTVAIPVSHAGVMVEAIERSGIWVPPAPRAWLGITCITVGRQVMLAGILPDSPAEAAGLQPGDSLLAVDDEEVGDRHSLYRAIWRHTAESELHLRVIRDGELRAFSIRASSMGAYFS